MDLFAVGKKVVWLLGKIKNPPHFSYLVYHYLQINMPLNLARSIAKCNEKSFCKEENDFFLETYDGSNQSVHPDAIFYNDRYWLVVTPYPYGMEEYENPCLYSGRSLAELRPVGSNPFAQQREHKIGFHLSDPCLALHNGELICVYRENTKEREIAKNYLYVKKTFFKRSMGKFTDGCE